MKDFIKDGGPAFPCEWDYINSNRAAANGMTLRDYFAAKAMHQFLHGAVLPVGYDATKELALLSDRAYETADAMLKAREA